MSKAGRYLSLEESRWVAERSDWKGAALVAHAWALIFGAMALFFYWPNPLTFIAALMVIGGRQLGLAILMHDGAHGILFKTRKINDVVSQWLCAFPVFSETWSYRNYHLKHHRFTQTEKDPDLSLSAPFPITKESLRRKIIRDLTGQTALKQRRAQLRAALGRPDWPFEKRAKFFVSKLGGAILVNLILLAILSLWGHPFAYLYLWVLPFATWHQLIIRIRNIGEHAVVPDHQDIFMNARTTKAGWLMRTLLAPYYVNYHAEHHMMMYVPCYHLPRAHELLRRKGYHEQMTIAPSYREVLRIATSADNDNNRGSGKGAHVGMNFIDHSA
ncbi:MAG: fatty acid desaturase [Alphaproteobacteria bacterium]|nr:MAG: fatty acid desaturase [Alphaproteobacteria bacterium]